jgi:hypothetical protein
VRRPRLTYANVTATLALCLAMTSPAWGDPVANSAASLKKTATKALGFGKKANKRAKKALKTANRALAQGGKPGPGGPQGAQGPQGPQGATGATGAQGTALAYGRVAADGTLSHNSGNVTVTKGTTGVYCIAVTGASDTSRPLLLSPDFNGNDTLVGTATIVDAPDPLTGSFSQQSMVEWDSLGVGCALTAFRVRTGVQTVDTTANTVKIEAADDPFVFAVP